MKRKIKKLLKKSVLLKYGIYPYIIAFALIAVLPLLRYTPFPENNLHGAAETKQPMVTVNLPFEDGSYAIFNTDTNKLVAHDSGFTKSFALPGGGYRIEFAEKFGYSTPNAQKFYLSPSSDVIVNADFYPIYNYPLLGVKIFPENAMYKIYDEQGKMVANGKGSDFFQMPAGNYKIEFLSLPGFKSPGNNSFFLADGVITTVNAAYGVR